MVPSFHWHGQFLVVSEYVLIPIAKDMAVSALMHCEV